MFSLVCTPDHLAILAISSSVPYSVAVLTNVLSLLAWPNIGARTITHVILEMACELALIVIVFNSTVAVQPAIFVPGTLVGAAANLNHAFTA